MAKGESLLRGPFLPVLAPPWLPEWVGGPGGRCIVRGRELPGSVVTPVQ
jgi:hypothetical protein